MDIPVRIPSTDQTMDLYATGFNAWNQLTFDTSPVDEEPDDVFAFTKVLAAEAVGRIASQLSYTFNKIQPGPSLDHPLASFFTVKTTKDFCSTLQVLSQGMAAVRQITAYDAGFIILLEDQTVLSCGDPRFRDCLGREVDESRPASEPGVIQDLSDLGEPIKKIAAAGYTAAALTESGGLYLWGMAPPGSQSRHNVFQDISELPNYFEVDGDKDVQDIGLGESHAIALTTDGCIYIIGDNTNGQVGHGKDVQDPISSWSKIDFTPPEGWAIIAVEAGPRSSFIVTKKVKQSQSS
ncbi:uncharacterized protein FFUJ_09878 [Fusarium fujikuroi IMI 58289]|uniref:Uncharacterized protein n=1 Tax=Gibberella fujikuroi (strain CBS 195.34 / IMI 58289 / NRRL A-6831) TaxID=1279085 RepID=S0EH58_GIBF5|nr:uncharacterized protein FFUJ_09878 [Fusarium fujikuroi IMI 58289]KLO80737.1 uncharacterized protein LW93_8982 [Fusarium fujikuroi]KLP12295.1 uncharacterized protein Y057_12006 [Fusarium fujikuroi]KLP20110.1 uncharacterized protein LW94_4019 [Fusarium fujikuroi]CCT74099.1 uncharacterized protein FFUJ_09878 [Fusarium fujikuroi IMI 58289]